MYLGGMVGGMGGGRGTTGGEVGASLDCLVHSSRMITTKTWGWYNFLLVRDGGNTDQENYHAASNNTKHHLGSQRLSA